MAANAGVTLDTITIEIESSAGGATANIEKLTKTLGELKSSIKGGFNNLKKLADALNTLNKASEGIPNAIKKLNNLREISQVLSSLDKIQKPKGLKSVIDNLEKIPATFSKIDTTVLDNVARVSNGLANALNPLANNLSKVSMGLSSLSTMAKNYGMSLTRVGDASKYTSTQMETLGRTGKFVGKSLDFILGGAKNIEKIGVRAFKNLHSKIKQVGLSLLGTRTLFTAIRKAISEYMAMDVQLTKATQNLWRALGAQLAPTVEYVLFLFKHIVRVIYSVVYALTGIDLIARANAKALESMGKSAGKALGNLQKFDDLNVVEFDKGNEDIAQIELDKIDLSPIQKVIDWMKRLKEAIQTAWRDGGWDEVAIVLADGVNQAFGALDPVAWGQKIGNGIVTGLSFIKTFLLTVNWGDVGKKIGDTIRNLPWAKIWGEIVGIAKAAFDGFDEFIDGLFDSKVAGELVISIGAIIFALNKLNDFKLVDIFASWATGIATAKTAIADLGTKIANIAALSKGSKALSILSPETVKAMTGLGPKLQSTALPALSKFFGFFTGGSLGATAGIVAAVVVGVMALVAAFKNLYENSEPFRNTVDALIASIKDYLITLIGQLKEMLMSLWDTLVVIWEQVLVPLFDLLVSIVEPFLKALIEIVLVLWDNAIKPLAEGLMKILKPAFMIVMDVIKALVVVIGGIIDVIQWLWSYLLEPIVSFILDVVVGAIKAVGAVIEWIIDFIVALVETTVTTLALGWATIKSGFVSLYKSVKEKFIDPFVKAWNSVVDGIDKAWENIKTSVKNGINGVIGFINGMIDGINNKLSFKVSAEVAAILNAVGFDVKEGKYQLLTIPTIPKLETGTNEIPYEGLYHLHPGEAVVPKKYNPVLGNGGNDEMNQKLDTLIAIMNNMSFTNVVNVGNETLYRKQQKYNKQQNDKYGTTVNL